MENNWDAPDTENENRSKDIARLNDALRRNGIGGKVLITVSVQQLSSSLRGQLITAISMFENFCEDNDPHGEHDFGQIELEGTKYFWKIDYYDENYEGLSPDPLDMSVTRRVMTVMRADEY